MGLPGPEEGLELALPIWESSGNKVYDYSGNQNNSSTFYGGPEWKPGGGIDLPGIDNWIDIPHSDSIDMDGVGAVTIVVGLRLYGWGQGNQGRIVDKDGGTAARNHGWAFFPNINSAQQNGDPVFAVNAIEANWNMNGSAGLFELNKDLIVGVSWNKDSHCRFFKNGQFHSADATYHTSTINGSGATYPARIGARPDGARELDGRIYFIYVFSKALNDFQFQVINNNPYGVFEQVRDYRIWSFVSGGETFYKTIAGNQPASAGSVVSAGVYKQTVVGNIPNPAAVIVRHVDTQLIGNMPTPMAVIVRKTTKELTGSQPNPIGSVVPISIYKQAISGDTPNPTAIIVKGIKKDVVGDMPSSIADITKKISIQVAGILPATTATIIKKTEKELAGEQLAPAGDVTYKSVYKQVAAGNVPASVGSLSSTIKTVLALAGNMPASIGSVIKRISKMLVGNQPATTGNIIKQTEKNVTGDMSSATGGVSHTTKTFLSGVMGNITGIVSKILNPIPPTTFKLCKLIGSCFKKFLG
jgi:hypothetical protein